MKRLNRYPFYFQKGFREIGESSMFVEKPLQQSKIFMQIWQIYSEPAEDK